MSGDNPQEFLKLTPLGTEPDDDILLFESGLGPATFYNSLFGGHLLGQAVAAAVASVPDRAAHSFHAYFLAAGKPERPVRYKVEQIRDGRNFAHRRVTAFQDEALLTMTCVLRHPETGLSHQRAMPHVPPPEDLVDIKEILRTIDPTLPARIIGHFAGDNPIELRPVSGAAALERQSGTRRQAWVRIPGMSACTDQGLHQAALAWMSDFWISSAALVQHRHPLPGPDLLLASIDHALWFHEPVRTDDWLLYDVDSPAAAQGTGLTQGSLFDRSGKLVASVTQDILQRLLT